MFDARKRHSQRFRTAVLWRSTNSQILKELGRYSNSPARFKACTQIPLTQSISPQLIDIVLRKNNIARRECQVLNLTPHSAVVSRQKYADLSTQSWLRNTNLPELKIYHPHLIAIATKAKEDKQPLATHRVKLYLRILYCS